MPALNAMACSWDCDPIMSDKTSWGRGTWGQTSECSTDVVRAAQHPAAGTQAALFFPPSNTCFQWDKGLHCWCCRQSESVWPESELSAPKNPGGGIMGGVRSRPHSPRPLQRARSKGWGRGCCTLGGQSDGDCLAAAAASPSSKIWAKPCSSAGSPSSSHSAAAEEQPVFALPLPFFWGATLAEHPGARRRQVGMQRVSRQTHAHRRGWSGGIGGGVGGGRR